MSYLFTHKIISVSKVLAVLIILSISENPDREGSATIKTISTALNEAMTGHPIPGDPSIIAKLVSLRSYLSSVFYFTHQ